MRLPVTILERETSAGWSRRSRHVRLLLLLVCAAAMVVSSRAQTRSRGRDLGIPFPGQTGPLNAITDVAGVKVGQTTISSGDSIHTGITAILPGSDNPFLDRVPAAVFVGNAFGKLVGSTQVEELGELETPILLTCTLCVWRAADGLVAELLDMPRMDRVRSINPVVGETNDGGLNDIRSRPITRADVHAALANASSGPVAEGSVGAGAGTEAFQWKGGIGTSSRVLPKTLGGYTVGVLVQTNFGGVLQVLGAPVGKELGRYAYRSAVEGTRGDGSCMIVVATDAPIGERNLKRVAARAMMGLARTGSSFSNGSGDFAIAFSTSPQVRKTSATVSPPGAAVVLRSTTELQNDDVSPLFEAVIEATEEAIYNSLFMATSVTYRGHTVDAIPLDRVREILDRYRVTKR